MYNNMQSFGSGPQGSGMISGRWMNKKTGSYVNVRDAIMQGDDMIVLTDKGQINGPDFSANYIQMSEEEYDMKGNVIQGSSKETNPASQPKPKQTKPSSQVRMFDDEVNTTIQKPVKQKQVSNINQETESIKLIKKLFSKIESKPEVTIDIKWAEFPANELNMLMNVFDVTKEDIADYMRTYLDDKEIKISLGKFIEKML